MVNPTTGWDKVPVYGFYFAADDTTPLAGSVRMTVTQRVTRQDGRRIYAEGATVERVIGDTSDAAVRDAVRTAWRAADAAAAGGSFDAAAWDTKWAILVTGAVFASFPASDDPDILGPYQVKVEEKLTSGKGATYYIQPLLAHLALTPPGINLGLVQVPMAQVPVQPIYAKGVAGGVAALDAQGRVLDGAGQPVGTSTTGMVPLTQRGAPLGVATLDVNGIVPVTQLPDGGATVLIDQTTGLPYIATA